MKTSPSTVSVSEELSSSEQFDSDSSLDLAPLLDWRAMEKRDHFVQFYERDAALLDSLSGYIATGLEQDEACIVIATPAHLQEMEHQLTARGLNLSNARAIGRYVPLDARETLAAFMLGEVPDPSLFRHSVGQVVAEAATRGRHVRAFGEMVALLCDEGNRSGAIALEDLWNQLAKEHSFCLYCAYRIDSFGTGADAAAFADICSHHSRVVPAESYSTVTSNGGREREIALLQQKARALEAEIARRKEVEQALLKRERELADFFDNAVEGLHKVGRDGSILWANRAELKMLGYEPEEYIGHKISEFHVDQDVIRDMLDRLLLGEPLYNHPARLRCKDGSIRHVLVHSNGHFEDGTFLHTRCFTRDVTERYEMQEALQSQLEEIEGLNSRLKRSVTETHHRVKNNLQVISAMIEMLALDHKGQDAVPLSEFSRIQSHVRTLAIVHDLLTASAKETEEIQTVSTSDVLGQLMPMLQQTAWNRTVHFQIAEAKLLSKQCVSLALIINELVSNALKHGRTEVDVTFTIRDGAAELAVCDDGPGFPEGFDPVRSANTGIELVASLVRTDLRGEARYENRAGGGARVVVEFTPAQAER